jgi:hypothetical protein
MQKVVLELQNLPTNLSILSMHTQHMTLLEILLVEAYDNDKSLFEIIKDIENRKKQQKDILLA